MPDSASRGIGAAYTPNYDINDILRVTQSPRGGTFRRVAASIAGGAANVFMPGMGSTVAGLISGGRLNSTNLLGNETVQFLELQRNMQMESRAFETASAVLKSRHDASMAAIRNMK